MKYRLLDILRCLQCNKKLEIEVFSIARKSNQLLSQTKCRNYCAFTGKALKAITTSDCEECYSHEIIDGSLTCSNKH